MYLLPSSWSWSQPPGSVRSDDCLPRLGKTVMALPTTRLPLPRTSSLMILPSVRVAATEMVHGATLQTEPIAGPLLPAEVETTTPRRAAWNAPTASVSAG